MANPRHNVSMYFTSLEIESVRCFGQPTKLDLTDDAGNPAQWTLLLGDNGVGKTTLLQCLAWMRPLPKGREQSNVFKADDESDEPPPLTKGSLGPALSDEENDVLESLLRTGKTHEVLLRAEMCQNKEFVNSNKDTASVGKGARINTGVKITYSKKGALEGMKPMGNTKIETIGEYHEPFIIAYGANRQMGLDNLVLSELDDPIAARLSAVTTLYDAEEILQNLDYAAAKKEYEGKENALLLKFKHLLAQILPDTKIKDVKDIEINAPNMLSSSSVPGGVRVNTFSGLVPLSALSLGYRTTLAWTIDLAWRLFSHYPKSPNPLSEPAVVLVDEIDLHLHPRWQRTIMDDLTELFPRVQFIATAHSPLMVQSTPDANLAVAQKENDEVIIVNDPEVVRSWRVDQILTSELFGVPASRDKNTEKLFREKEALLDKTSLSPQDEARLSKIDSEIAALETADNPADQKAMRLIREAAAILKKQKVLQHDQSRKA
jgi:energy-coupling factor transporter ATP-binding protein EcfA2